MLYSKVDSNRLIKATERLSSEIRLSGAPEELRAMEWLKEKLDELEWETEILHHPAYISLPGKGKLIIGDRELPCIVHSFSASTGQTPIEASLSIPKETTKVDANQVDGKIAVLQGLPMGHIAHHWEKAGAIGQIYIQGDHLHEMQVSVLWGPPTSRNRTYLLNTPLVSITKQEGDRLHSSIEKGDTIARLETKVDTSWREIPLLIANLYGDRSVNDFVLFSSHVDSWHYGAMDNAAANATVLEVARLLVEKRKDFHRNLRLAFWSGHSHGRWAGSTWYADNNFNELDEHCCAHVNVDSTGGKGAEIIEEVPVMAETKQLVGDVIAEVTKKIFRGRRIGRFADHSFTGIGISSLLGTFSEQPQGGPNSEASSTGLFGGKGRLAGGLGWWWHTSEDTIDKIDSGILTRDTKVYVRTIERLLCDPVLPFDFIATAVELQECIEKVSDWCGNCYDLSPAMHENELLISSLRKFYQSFSGKTKVSSENINTCLKRLGRCLVPALYTEGNRFDFDLCLPVGPLPLFYSSHLKSAPKPGTSEFFQTMVEITRAQNCLVSSIKEARKVIES